MASSPSAGSSNFCDVISYISLPSFCLITLKVILFSPLRSTAALARWWKVTMFLSMETVLLHHSSVSETSALRQRTTHCQHGLYLKGQYLSYLVKLHTHTHVSTGTAGQSAGGFVRGQSCWRHLFCCKKSSCMRRQTSVKHDPARCKPSQVC